MKTNLTPSFRKSWIPVLLVALALVPSVEIRQLLFGALAAPYAWVVGHPPFPYDDKPWFLSPAGAVAVAVMWAIIVYGVLSFWPTKKKEPIQSPEPMPLKRHGSP